MSKTDKYSRRHFLQNVAIGGGGLIILGSYGFRIINDKENKLIKAISVDFEKCAGCRTCESSCSAFNNPILIEGENLNGIGNPHLSNIRVYHYNPDVDVPVTCAICPDAPCVEACPVEPDPDTGRKALYRDSNMTIKNDLERCIACAQCAEACKSKRAGVIIPNPETNKPERMCTLCNGSTQCVKNCPFDALSYIEMKADRDLSELAPAQIAELLIKQFYHVNI